MSETPNGLNGQGSYFDPTSHEFDFMERTVVALERIVELLEERKAEKP